VQDIVVERVHACGNFIDFLADSEHCITEAIQFFLAFTLRRLYHDGSGNRKTERGCVETIVHQALGNIFGADHRLERPQIDNEFMGRMTIFTFVEDAVSSFQSRLDVISVEDGISSGIPYALSAQHFDVSVADEQNACTAKRR